MSKLEEQKRELAEYKAEMLTEADSLKRDVEEVFHIQKQAAIMCKLVDQYTKVLTKLSEFTLVIERLPRDKIEALTKPAAVKKARKANKAPKHLKECPKMGYYNKTTGCSYCDSKSESGKS